MTEAIDTSNRKPPPPPSSEDSGGGAFERLTVNLTRKSAAALIEASRLGDENKTNVVNKALLVYALLLRIQAQPGGVIYIRDGEGAELERVRLL